MRNPLGRLVLLVICPVVTVLWAGPAHAGLLYNQAPTISSGYYDTYTSSYVDSNSNYYLTLDNFSLASNSTVTGVSWQGMYLGYNSSTGDYGNAAPNSTSWFIEIFDSNLNLLQYQQILGGNVSETFAGTATFGNSSGDNETVSYYNESTQLSTGFSLNGNQAYYVAIFSVSSSPSSGDFWSWMSGTGGDGVSDQYSTYTNTTSQISLDRAFSLTGTAAVPEPSSVLLATISLGGLAGYSRRKRSNLVRLPR